MQTIGAHLIGSAHEQLYFKAKILHSDIHDKNVLLKAVDGLSPGSRRVGFLIDLNYGMPTDETRDKASSGLRSVRKLYLMLRMKTNACQQVPHVLCCFRHPDMARIVRARASL